MPLPLLKNNWNSTLITWYYCLAYSQSIDDYKWNHKTFTLAATFHNSMGGANQYVQFVYCPHKNVNRNQGQVSVSISAYSVNAKYTDQKSTK